MDICLSIATGLPTRLLDVQGSQLPYQGLSSPDSHTNLQSKHMLPFLDKDLLDTWYELRRYSAATNLGPASSELFQTVSVRIPSRLLTWRYAALSLSETTRLCLLAYVKSILFTIPGLGRIMHYLYDKLKAHLRVISQTRKHGRSLFMLWAMFVSAISIFEDNLPPWFHSSLKNILLGLEIGTWEQCRAALAQNMWIYSLHDMQAQALFYSVMGSASR